MTNQVTLRIELPIKVATYLEELAKTGLMGETVEEVAIFLIRQGLIRAARDLITVQRGEG